MIRPTRPEDLETLLAIYAHAREQMKKNGNPNQWGTSWPSDGIVREDIRLGRSFAVEEEGTIRGVFVFFVGHDRTYDVIREGEWLNDEPYGVIHRIAAAEDGRQIMHKAIEFGKQFVGNIRIDTHENNVIMRHCVTKEGFSYCGHITTDNGTDRLAFQKVFR